MAPNGGIPQPLLDAGVHHRRADARRPLVVGGADGASLQKLRQIGAGGGAAEFHRAGMRHGVQQGAEVNDRLHPLLPGQASHGLGIGPPAQVGLDAHKHHHPAAGFGIGQVKKLVGRPVNMALAVPGAGGRGPGLGEIVKFLRVKLGELTGFQLALQEFHRAGRPLGGVGPAAKGEQQRMQRAVGLVVNGKKVHRVSKPAGRMGLV